MRSFQSHEITITALATSGHWHARGEGAKRLGKMAGGLGK